MTYVYPVAKDLHYGYPALKVSLRSLVHQGYPDVIIIGGRPKWLKLKSSKVTWIDLDPTTKNPYYNVIRKIDRAAEMCREFILMNDDMIFLKPLVIEANKMYSRKWKYMSKRNMLSEPVSTFSKSLHNTAQEFTDAIDYDTHFPWYVDSEKWKALWQNFDKNKLYQYKSLYGNFHQIERIPTHDCKILDFEQLKSGNWNKPVVSTSNIHERNRDFRNYFSYLLESPYETA